MEQGLKISKMAYGLKKGYVCCTESLYAAKRFTYCKEVKM